MRSVTLRQTNLVFALALSLLVTVAGILSADEPPSLTGQVVDDLQGVLPGTTVTLTLTSQNGMEPFVTVTDASGHFSFDGLPAGFYSATFWLPGFDEKRLESIVVPAPLALKVVLSIGAFAETVVVRGTAVEAEIQTPAGESAIEDRVLTAIPLARDRFEDALPLVPGVVRGPDGLLNMKGARAHESAVLVNGLNAMDPVTGHAAARLPLEAVETLKVHTGVYSAAYGSATGGVTDVVTRPGTDAWGLQVQNFFPRLRFKEGGVRGFDSFTPRVRFSGPIRPGNLWLSQSLNYRFVRSRVDELRPLDASEQILESFDSLAQFDYAPHSGHHLTGTVLWFPSDVDNANIDTLHPLDATPDIKQRGWNTALSDTAVLSNNLTLASSFSVKQFNVAVLPKHDAPSFVTVNGVRDNYFNRFDRDSRRYDASSTLTAAIGDRWGDHLLRAGGQFAHTSFDGIDASLPVLVTRADGTPVRRIDFLEDAAVRASNNEAAAFVQDEWSVDPRLTLHAGLRYGHDGISGDHTLAPRFDASVRPFGSQGTVVKGGIGRFYDKLALNADGFDQHQQRRVTEFDGAGAAGPSVLVHNRRGPGGLRTPQSTRWNVELDRELSKNLRARIAYRRASGSRQLVVDPSADNEALVLSSTGRSRSRELEATVRRRFGTSGELSFSYVRSRASGNLNDFVSLFGDTRDPIVHRDEYSHQPFDVPNRFVMWGVLNLPYALTVSPTVEYRNGFPYTVVNELQETVGPRNRGARYPNLFTLDLAVTKDVPLSRNQRARVGVQLFNLTGHFNPRDVQNNTGSSTFGRFANSADRHVRAKFTLLF